VKGNDSITMGGMSVEAYWLVRVGAFPSSWLLLLVDCSGFLVLADEVLCKKNREKISYLINKDYGWMKQDLNKFVCMIESDNACIIPSTSSLS
jgi:hypothetical protein